MTRNSQWPEIGRDTLDPLQPRVRPRWTPALPRRRPALGIHATAAPTLPFILLGVALGPHGLGLLSPAGLSHLGVVVSAALAVIGVLVALGMPPIGAAASRDMLGSALVTVVTAATVAAGMYVLVGSWSLALPVDPLAWSAVLGVCAAASAALHVPDGAGHALRRAARIADLDDMPLIILGTVAIAVLSGTGVGLSLLLTIAAGAAIGVSGCLLFERAESAAERGAFVTGSILLLAGVGSYLGTSPLLSGAVAALVWVRAPGAADRITEADLRVLQHPLVALLLIVAGASIQRDPRLPWIAAPLVLLALMGKLLASIALARIERLSPALVATVLLPPGIMGIALALNAQQVLGPQSAFFVPAVTTAAAVSELLAACLPGEQGES